jgi:hypothetical protein
MSRPLNTVTERVAISGIEESVGSGREYGALYSTSDMTVFDSVVEQFQRFECDNVLNFTYQFIIDMQDLTFRYHITHQK